MEIKEWKGLDAIIEQYISSEKYLSFDGINLEKLAHHLAPRMINATIEPAFWQKPDFKIQGKPIIFPANNEDTLQYCLVAVAQFFSYWYKDGTTEQLHGKQRDIVKNWGIMLNGEFVDDTIAVLYCLFQSSEIGINLLDAKRLKKITAADVDAIYLTHSASVAPIPMREERQKKFSEIGEGLLRFANDFSTRPHFIEMLKISEGKISKIIGLMQQYFPYSYGDPFAKLALLCIKILWDRTTENRLKHNLSMQTISEYDQLLSISDHHLFDAMADYMVPLFLIRTGIVKINDADFYQSLLENRELTGLNEVENSYRAFTLQAVRLLASRIASINGIKEDYEKYCGWLRFVLDSVFWQNALFICKYHTYDAAISGKCPFAKICRAVHDEKLMMTGFPLVRTTNY